MGTWALIRPQRGATRCPRILPNAQQEGPRQYDDQYTLSEKEHLSRPSFHTQRVTPSVTLIWSSTAPAFPHTSLNALHMTFCYLSRTQQIVQFKGAPSSTGSPPCLMGPLARPLPS
ncbi:hypothetical protein FA13DRAFT_1726480 [Coprinellus micaceus]|uniref:Uncharacterized protein n=1 Tax=Coprinellus micaceus TaxID=71717 RepID=A0A4Y7TT86_COPMI|nr:hypothetical protein FA13DRAFT_1726480 [Coprinellus micaceus]